MLLHHHQGFLVFNTISSWGWHVNSMRILLQKQTTPTFDRPSEMYLLAYSLKIPLSEEELRSRWKEFKVKYSLRSVHTDPSWQNDLFERFNTNNSSIPAGDLTFLFFLSYFLFLSHSLYICI